MPGAAATYNVGPSSSTVGLSLGGGDFYRWGGQRICQGRICSPAMASLGKAVQNLGSTSATAMPQQWWLTTCHHLHISGAVY